jgi:outer membrane lipoprotein SlyB
VKHLLLTLLMAVALMGCATSYIAGVTITDEERASCALEQNCSVWSLEQLRQLVLKAMQAGVEHGRKTERDSL